MRKIFCFILIIAIDFFTKFWVTEHIPLMQFYLGYPFGGIGIIDTELFKVAIVHTTNTGTAWGLFAGFQGILMSLRILIALALFVYLVFCKPAKALKMPLTLILAGAIGNIADFFIYGHVVDMICCIFYTYSYPIFNVADAVIFCAVVYLFFNRKRMFLFRAPRH